MSDETLADELIEVEDAEPVDTTEAEIETEDDGETIITIGDEAAPASEDDEKPWVREVRRKHREAQIELRKLREENELLKRADKPSEITLGPKPTREAFDYDDDAYDAAVDAWIEQRDAFKAQEVQRAESRKAQERKWQETLGAYESQKTALGVRDFDLAEDAVKSDFDDVQLNIILHSAEDKAKIIYALGTNDAQRARLASIKDPVVFAFQVGRLSGDIKMEKRKAATQPESTVRPSGTGAAGINAKLERLEAEAAKTGNYTALFEYRRTLSG